MRRRRVEPRSFFENLARLHQATGPQGMVGSSDTLGEVGREGDHTPELI